MTNTETIERQNILLERSAFSYPFIFDDRNVNGTIIACPHNSQNDTDFILSILTEIGDYTKTLFIEQGSPKQNDRIEETLRELASRNPRIGNDFTGRQDFGYGRFNRVFLDRRDVGQVMPFAAAADFWLANSGHVVNIDSYRNSSSEALHFVAQELSPDIALESVYFFSFRSFSSPKDTMPMVISELFPELPQEFIAKRCEEYYGHFVESDPLDIVRRVLFLERELDTVRDKYMSIVIEKKLGEGDIVLAYPTHINAILKTANARKES